VCYTAPGNTPNATVTAMIIMPTITKPRIASTIGINRSQNGGYLRVLLSFFSIVIH
jgi:hypothetical protein